MDIPDIVYVKVDEQNRVIDSNSGAFLADIAGWVEIDRGSGDRYHHAQNNYFDAPKFTEEGIPRYKLTEENKVVERTGEEIAADIAALPAQEATEADYVAALEELGVQFDA